MKSDVKRQDNILVFNCGSSSLKYALIQMPDEKELAGGEAQRVGPQTTEPSRIVHRRNGQTETHTIEMPNHAAAFEKIMNLLAQTPGNKPSAFGHRMVHGSDRFDRHVIADADALKELTAIQNMAPLHNPPATEFVAVCRERHPDLPQVIVFDTVYHATIPEHAYTYALPRTLREDMGFRKYGFHGTSHNYVAEEATRLLGKPLNETNLVSCHLGSGGASLCAIVNGRSVDNTMGYSPLQGLIMSTRSGDLDPAAIMAMVDSSGRDPDAVEQMLNRKSGVLGMSAISSDIRDVLAALKGDAVPDQVAHALQIYLWRIRKYLGAYLTVVGNADAVIFTDTVGEEVPDVRWAVGADMAAFGLALDPKRNAATGPLPADIAADDSAVRALVIHTNEELAIARHTYRIIRTPDNTEDAA